MFENKNEASTFLSNFISKRGLGGGEMIPVPGFENAFYSDSSMTKILYMGKLYDAPSFFTEFKSMAKQPQMVPEVANPTANASGIALNPTVTPEDALLKEKSAFGIRKEAVPTAYPKTTPEARACPADVKRCPDGSMVGRSGPNCTFVCPGGSDEKSRDWVARSNISKQAKQTESMPSAGLGSGNIGYNGY